MNNYSKYLRLSLLVGGVLILLIALMHAFLPEFGYPSYISEQMPAEVSGHFYFLGTYAIGSFLLTLSFLSFYFSLSAPSQTAFVFALSQVVLWSLRTVLEIIYPVTVPIFFLAEPTILILPAVAMIVFVYLVGSAAFVVDNRFNLRDLQRT